jgi:hypothetical protein
MHAMLLYVLVFLQCGKLEPIEAFGECAGVGCTGHHLQETAAAVCALQERLTLAQCHGVHAMVCMPAANLTAVAESCLFCIAECVLCCCLTDTLAACGCLCLFARTALLLSATVNAASYRWFQAVSKQLQR